MNEKGREEERKRGKEGERERGREGGREGNRERDVSMKGACRQTWMSMQEARAHVCPSFVQQPTSMSVNRHTHVR